jgi:hypothetical protein
MGLGDKMHKRFIFPILLMILILAWFSFTKGGGFLSIYYALLFFGAFFLLFVSSGTKEYLAWGVLLLTVNAIFIGIWHVIHNVHSSQVLSAMFFYSFIPLVSVLFMGFTVPTVETKNSFSSTIKYSKFLSKKHWVISLGIIAIIFVTQVFDFLVLFDLQGVFSSFYHPYTAFLIWILYLANDKAKNFFLLGLLFLLANIMGFLTHIMGFLIQGLVREYVLLKSISFCFLLIIGPAITILLVGALGYPKGKSSGLSNNSPNSQSQ